MKNFYLLLIILFGIKSSSFSQNHLHCGTDEIMHQLFENNPNGRKVFLKKDSLLHAFTKEFIAKKSANEPLYIIPVVFHVIHNNGLENISDAQIYDAVKQVNIQLRKQNADTSDIVNDFKSIAADTKIEIRLAQKDPDGNCTSGITRTQSELTSIGDHQLKSLIHWPPEKYLNIYISREAAGLAGHAVMPAAADSIPAWDGIVMQASYIGTIGTSEYFKRTVLTHEIGHYLNLQHIWGGNNVPNFPYLQVAQQQNCNFDDDVQDTPNTIGWQSCNLQSQSCGSLDNIQNYMDYAYCALMFTEGQKNRMQATLNSPIAGRNNLVSEQNLIETGVKGICNIDFVSSKKTACVGDSISFSMSVWEKSLEYISWHFEGGNPAYSTEQNPTIVYQYPGKYKVSLMVKRGGETATKTKEAYINILPNMGRKLNYSEDFENVEHLKNTLVWCDASADDDVKWEINNNIGKASNACIWLNNINSKSVNYELVSQAFDASNTNNHQLIFSFDYAYSKRIGSANEFLRVQFSNNCGQTWTNKLQLTGASLETTAPTENSFSPNSDADWQNKEIILTAADKVPHLQIRFLVQSRGGNNFFIDNINLKTTAFDNQADAEFTSNKNAVCTHQEVQFINLSSNQGVSKYEWNFEGATPNFSTEKNPKVSYLDSGIFNVSLKIEKSGIDDTELKQQYIQVRKGPEIPVLKEDNTWLVVANASPNYQYQWFYNDFYISGETNDSIFITENAEMYQVSVSDSSFCEIFSKNKSTTEEEGNIIIPEINAYRIYPNPTQGATQLELLISEKGNLDIEVFDILGRKIDALYLGKLEAGKYLIHLDSEKYSRGMFLIQIIHLENKKVLKLIKK
jgi:PKD repeat protein